MSKLGDALDGGVGLPGPAIVRGVSRRCLPAIPLPREAHPPRPNVPTAGIEQQIARLSEIESLQEEWQIQVGGLDSCCLLLDTAGSSRCVRCSWRAQQPPAGLNSSDLPSPTTCPLSALAGRGPG